MLNQLFTGIFDTTGASLISVSKFILCMVVSLIIGCIIAATYCYKSHYTRSFVVTLAMLPTVVCVVIMMVNGNVGAGVAVAGAFSLVRFRSVPGTAKEIGTIFLAMGAGLIAGMGYLGYAVLFALIMCLVLFLCSFAGIGNGRKESLDKTLRITIPEDLDYSDIFDDLLNSYTKKWEVVSVKTSNMGSLFKLTYNITMKESVNEKKFVDELRCRNGNLEISISKQAVNNLEL